MQKSQKVAASSAVSVGVSAATNKRCWLFFPPEGQQNRLVRACGWNEYKQYAEEQNYTCIMNHVDAANTYDFPRVPRTQAKLQQE